MSRDVTKDVKMELEVCMPHRYSRAELINMPATLVLLPGRLAAHYTGLAKGSDHEQILSMFANTAFWTLVGVIVVLLVV
jgi:hypothetical protein